MKLYINSCSECPLLSEGKSLSCEHPEAIDIEISDSYPLERPPKNCPLRKKSLKLVVRSKK